MKVIYRGKENKFDVQLDESDDTMVRKMREAFSTEGFAYFLQAMGAGREAMIENLMKEVNSVSGRKLSDIRAAILKGFYAGITLQSQIIIAYERLQEDKINAND